MGEQGRHQNKTQHDDSRYNKNWWIGSFKKKNRLDFYFRFHGENLVENRF